MKISSSQPLVAPHWWVCDKGQELNMWEEGEPRRARPIREGARVSETKEPRWGCEGDQAFSLVLPGSVFIGTRDVILHMDAILQWAAGNQCRSQARLHQCGGSHRSPPHTSAIEQQLTHSLATDQMIKICYVFQIWKSYFRKISIPVIWWDR